MSDEDTIKQLEGILEANGWVSQNENDGGFPYIVPFKSKHKCDDREDGVCTIVAKIEELKGTKNEYFMIKFSMSLQKCGQIVSRNREHDPLSILLNRNPEIVINDVIDTMRTGWEFECDRILYALDHPQ